MELTTRQSFELGLLLVVVALVLRRRLPWAWRWGGHAAVVLFLFGTWQYGLGYGVTTTAGAVDNGVRVWDLERTLDLPSEATLQRAVLRVPGLMHGLDVYYATVHFGAMGLLLAWLTAFHHERYHRVLTTVIGVTGAAMFIQWLPVAPPRLIPELGVLDAPAVLGDSVYGPGGLSSPGQLIAMPSVHVAWSLIIAVAVVQASRSRWRWWIVAHPVVTVLAVCSSGNHYWLDGLVSAGLLALAMPAQALVRRVRAGRGGVAASEPRRTVSRVGAAG